MDGLDSDLCDPEDSMEGNQLMQRRVVKCAADGSITSEYYDDISWVQVRAARNRALADSDWRAVKDRTMSQAWKDYRQALRDLPQENATANDAADAWPVMPDA